MALDSSLIRDLKTFAVDPGILKKLEEHTALNDLDVNKLIQQLYNVGFQAHKSRVAFTNPFGMSDGRPVHGRTDKVFDMAAKNRG